MIEFELTPGIAYYKGENIETERHTHHALEFIFAADKSFSLLSDEIILEEIYAVVIDSNCPHKFIGKDGQYLFVYLEPDLLQIEQIRNYYNLSVKKIVTLGGLACLPSVENIINFSFFSDILDITIDHTMVTEMDNRIQNVIKYIKNNLEYGQFKSDTLAESIFLSTSRFSHLFKEQVGLPLRRYILWCRIRKALEALLNGQNFTKSAHAAGFSDSAHFSRTFSEMFGVSPSSVLKNLSST
jgi:AraC-like DNA-binding protein